MRLPIGILVMAFAALVAAAPARALDPARSIAQYKHTRWTNDEGAPAPIAALAEGRDGYLWVGGAGGLYRFDGLNFELIPARQPPPSNGLVSAIMVARNGDVWAGYSAGGSSIYRNGELKVVAMPDATYVIDLAETPDGSVWALLGRPTQQIYRFRNGRWSEVSSELGFPDTYVAKMIVARDGTLYVSTSGSGVVFLPPGGRKFERADVNGGGSGALSQARDGTIWSSNSAGSRPLGLSPAPLRRTGASAYPTPEATRKVGTIFDKAGNLWGITEEGIYRLRTPVPGGPASTAAAAESVSRYQQQDGLTTQSVRTIIEDHEGNIWVGTGLGLDRFREANVVVEPALTKRAGRSDVLLAATDGSVYVGERDAIYRVRPRGPPVQILTVQDPMALCEGPDGAVWIVDNGRVLRLKGGQLSRFGGPGKTDLGIFDCAVDSNNRIWLAAGRSGIFRLVDGRWRQSMVPPAQSGYAPAALLRRRGGAIAMLYDAPGYIDPTGPPKRLGSSSDGSDMMQTLYESQGRMLFGSMLGIGDIEDGRVRLITTQRFPALKKVSGIAQTRHGQTWLSTSSGPVVMASLALDRALADPNAPLPMRGFDFRDGLPGVPVIEVFRTVVEGGDGRLWFSTAAGTVWIDPNHLARNPHPPPVRISAISTAGRTIRDPAGVELPAGTRSVQIDFAALSLSVPDRVQMRYRLSGEDQAWIDPGTRRQAFYTNLGPGHHVFQVIAANNDGVWNRQGATLAFDIPPTFRQSTWFLTLCMAGIGVLLWCAYRIRVRQLTGRMRERLEQRLAERERIARDLHDTLLQGFQGLILRFQSVVNEIPQELRAHRLFGEALDTADAVLREGRDSVTLLRTADRADIAATLSDTAKRMRASYPAEFQMVVEGTPRALQAIVRSEVCRIGEEAIINAFQHARASVIEVALSYGAADLTLGVRDNGIGIDASILDQGGRQGHFGLVGMQERAGQIDADFSVSSRPGAGTEINLTVPGKIAYVTRYRNWWRPWLRPMAMAGAARS